MWGVGDERVSIVASVVGGYTIQSHTCRATASMSAPRAMSASTGKMDMGMEIGLEGYGGRRPANRGPGSQWATHKRRVATRTRIWQLSADGEVEGRLVGARCRHVDVEAGARDEEVRAASGERIAGDVAHLVQRRGKARLNH